MPPRTVQIKPEDASLYRQAWEDYFRYGDHDPQVKAMALAYEAWIEQQARHLTRGFE